MEKEAPGFFITLDEIIQLNALTIVTHRQVEDGNIERLKMCLGAGAKVNCRHDSKTLVASALIKNDQKVLEALWDFDKSGWTTASDAYRTAIQYDRKEWFEKMITTQNRAKATHKLESVLPDAATLRKWWAFEKAFNEFPRDFQKGLSNYADNQYILTEICKDKKAPQKLFEKMVEACADSWKSEVRFFSLSGDRMPNIDPVSPLTMCLKNNDFKRAEYLLDHGYPINSNIDYRSYDNWYEIAAAMYADVSPEGVKWLLDKGASPFMAKSDKWGSQLVSKEDVELMWTNAVNDSDDAKPHVPTWDLALYLAIDKNKPEIGKMLIDHGCSIQRVVAMKGAPFDKKALAFERELLIQYASDKMGTDFKKNNTPAL